MELGPLPVHRNLADNGQFLFRTRRHAEICAVLANHLRMSAGSGCQKRAHRSLPANRPSILRGFNRYPDSRIRPSLRDGKRVLENIGRLHVPMMDASVDLSPHGNQRTSLVHSLRHARMTDGRRGHGRHFKATEKIRLVGARICRSDTPVRTLRVHTFAVPAWRMTDLALVPYVQSVFILTALPPLNGRRRDGDLRRNEPDEALVLVRFRFPIDDRDDFHISLEHPRSRRFRVFVAGMTVPVSPRSAFARHGAAYRSLHEEDLKMAR